MALRRAVGKRRLRSYRNPPGYASFRV